MSAQYASRMFNVPLGMQMKSVFGNFDFKTSVVLNREKSFDDDVLNYN